MIDLPARLVGVDAYPTPTSLVVDLELNIIIVPFGFDATTGHGGDEKGQQQNEHPSALHDVLRQIRNAAPVLPTPTVSRIAKDVPASPAWQTLDETSAQKRAADGGIRG